MCVCVPDVVHTSVCVLTHVNIHQFFPVSYICIVSPVYVYIHDILHCFTVHLCVCEFLYRFEIFVYVCQPPLCCCLVGCGFKGACIVSLTESTRVQIYNGTEYTTD